MEEDNKPDLSKIEEKLDKIIELLSMLSKSEIARNSLLLENILEE